MENDSRELDKQLLANKKFSDFFSEGLSLFGRNYGKIILPFAFFLVISNCLIVFLLTDLTWFSNELTNSLALIFEKFEMAPETVTEEELLSILQSMLLEIGVLGLESVIGAFFTVLSMCAVSRYLYKTYIYGSAKFSLELKEAFNKKILLAAIILGLCVPIGTFFFLFIPGIVLFYFYILLVHTYNIEEIKNPAKAARTIVKGNFWSIVGVFIASVIITSIINYPIQFLLSFAWNIDTATYLTWINPNTRNYPLLLFYQLSYDIIGILISPLFICLLTPLFATLKARYDLGYQKGYYQRRIGYEEDYPTYSSFPRQSEIHSATSEERIPRDFSDVKEGMYCPFCGFYIKTPKKFCVNCGESLQFD